MPSEYECPHCRLKVELTHKMQTLEAQYIAHAWRAHRIPKKQALRELRQAGVRG